MGGLKLPSRPRSGGGIRRFSDGGNRRDWFPRGSGAEGGFRPPKRGCNANYYVNINN